MPCLLFSGTGFDFAECSLIVAVRPFCNADLPQLVGLWNEHWGSIGPNPNVNIAQFEQALVARTFFRPENLLVFDSGGIQAWCVCFQERELAENGLIAFLCLANAVDPSVATQLIDAAVTRLVAMGASKIRVGVARDHRYGFAGLNPVGYGIGIPQVDSRIGTLLNNCGFSTEVTFQRLSATVQGYRPPVSRDAIQLRRSTQVDMVEFSHADQRSAAAMSHLDVEMLRLIDRTQTVLARIHLWFSDPEAEVMNPAMAIIDLSSRQSPDQLLSEEAYLCATAIQSLVARGIAVAETVVDTNHSELLEQLRGLNFQATDCGDVWVKQLSR